MDETVMIALVTSATGLASGIVGALAAVWGPWLQRRAERREIAETVAVEARRAAIVELVTANLHLTNHLFDDDPETAARASRVNAAFTEFSSRIHRNESSVIDWTTNATFLAARLDADDRRVVWHEVGQQLLAWHRKSIDKDALVPFVFDWTNEATPFVPVERWKH